MLCDRDHDRARVDQILIYKLYCIEKQKKQSDRCDTTPHPKKLLRLYIYLSRFLFYEKDFSTNAQVEGAVPRVGHSRRSSGDGRVSGLKIKKTRFWKLTLVCWTRAGKQSEIDALIQDSKHAENLILFPAPSGSYNIWAHSFFVLLFYHVFFSLKPLQMSNFNFNFIFVRVRAAAVMAWVSSMKVTSSIPDRSRNFS